MNRIYLICIIAQLVFSCNPTPETQVQSTETAAHARVLDQVVLDTANFTTWNPENQLSPEEIQNFKYQIVRYFERLPNKVSEENKFQASNDEYYRGKAEEAKLLYYAPQSNGDIYFAITKIAPSMKEKRVATVGKTRLSGNEVTYYEEKFRTWKMEVPELEETTAKLFQEYLQDRDLERYQTQFTDPEYIIEFPDPNNTFDTLQRRWRMAHEIE